jgi:hypothetical protein
VEGKEMAVDAGDALEILFSVSETIFQGCLDLFIGRSIDRDIGIVTLQGCLGPMLLQNQCLQPWEGLPI